MKEKSPRIWSNLAKVDATPAIPDDDIPEVTREDLDRATLSYNGVVLRGPRTSGGPLESGKKAPNYVRIDKDILAHFRATGRGWQTRLNAALRTAIKARPRAKAAKRKWAG